MIVITAPTSSIGKQVLHRLLDSYPDVRVIARDASRIEPADRERVSVVEGSHSDADVVARATEGADAAFWLVPPNPKAASVDEAYSRLYTSGARRHAVARCAADRGDQRARARHGTGR